MFNLSLTKILNFNSTFFIVTIIISSKGFEQDYMVDGNKVLLKKSIGTIGFGLNINFT